MKKHLASALIACSPLLANAGCLNVVGSVELTPDRDCTVSSMVPGVVFTEECFSVSMSLFGLPLGTGFAGITSETLIDGNGVPGVTPGIIPQDGQPTVARQIVHTARSAISIGSGAFRTTLFSSDVLVMKPKISATGQIEPDVVTEQIIITGTDGQGLFANATGHLVVLGNSIGQRARVRGEICR